MPGNKPRSAVTPQQLQAIHYLVLDRHAKNDISTKIAQMVGVQTTTVRRWRKLPYFREEFDRQVRLYRANFDDVALADRKERVLALQAIYEGLVDRDKAMKLKVLMAIRQEVGDDKQVVEHHVSGAVGVIVPPRAESYDEWIQQNESMYKAVGEDRNNIPDTPVPQPALTTAQIGTPEEDVELEQAPEEVFEEVVDRSKAEEQKRLHTNLQSPAEIEALDLTRKEVPIG